jgi:hypothetical protein
MSPTLRRAVPFLVAVGVLLVVLAVMGVARLVDPPGEGEAGTSPGGGGGSSGSSGSAGSSGSPGSPLPADPGTDAGAGTQPSQDEPQTRFTSVGVGADEATLDVSFWGGVDTCYRYEVRVDEGPDAVALSLAETHRSDGPCIDLAQEYRRTVTLDTPLGDRQVRDADTGEVVLDPRG